MKYAAKRSLGQDPSQIPVQYNSTSPTGMTPSPWTSATGQSMHPKAACNVMKSVAVSPPSLSKSPAYSQSTEGRR